MDFDSKNPLISYTEQQIDTVAMLFASESDYSPSLNLVETLKTSDCFRFSFRRQAISLILQVQYSCNFNPIVPYVAIAYMDRFVSSQEIVKEKPWILRLLVISCLSLASKMNDADLSFSNFQRDEGFIFDARTIRRMELLVLNALKWRVRLITPFSFLDLFLSFFDYRNPSLKSALIKDRATDIIFKVQYETMCLEFKPSIIAASALLSAFYQLLPVQLPSIKSSISSCEFVDKDKLLSCYVLMQDKIVLIDGNEAMLSKESSSTKTPISVLELDILKTRQNNSERDTVAVTTISTEETDGERET